MAGVLSSATSVLTRAVDLDSKGRYSEAVICYQEGLQLLMDVLKSQFEFKCMILSVYELILSFMIVKY